VGTPCDLVNVRMQNDTKLPFNHRRNYKHIFDGAIRVSREEDVANLLNGCSVNVMRGALMTIGQLAFYDQIKQMVLHYELGKDNTVTHLACSCAAGSAATALTMPLDVLKTRMMNAPVDAKFRGLVDCFIYTAKLGPSTFFKGFVPAWVRISPHTVILFLVLEQMRMYFGYLPVGAKPIN